MKRRVFLFSGGLDSVGAMMKMVVDPVLQHEPVKVFYMDYVNKPLGKAQRIAVQRAITHFPQIWDLYTYRNEGADLKHPLEAAIKAMQIFGSPAFQGDKEDATELELIVGYEFEEDDTTTVDELNEAVQLMRKAYLIAGIGLLPVSVVSPVKEMNKRQIADVVGAQTFWSCAFPNINASHYTPCGTCESCQQLAKYGIEHPSLHITYGQLCEKAFGV